MSARSDRSVPEEQAKPAAGDIVLFEDLNEGAADMAATDEAGVAQDQVDGPEPADPMDQRELHAIIEALLFVSHGPVTFDRLAAVLDGVPKAEVREAVRSLQAAFQQGGRGLQIVEVAGGLQLVTRPDYGPWIKRLEKSKPAPKLSRSALESLAIIAYKQPIVRAEIEQIRGVETSGVIRTLLERKLVRMVGRKDVPGRPIMYGTTKYFLQHFGLRDLAELPPLREFKELGESEQAMLPVGDEPLVMTATPESGAPADELSPEVEETV
jgi:segregation and condensation protein B